MDEILKQNLDLIKDLINNKDFDWLHIVCGKEGVGKSTLATELCIEVDHKFLERNNVITTVEELKRAFREAEKGSAILIDEGADMFYCRDAMTKETKEATQLLRGLRGKNCFVCLCMPDFFSLDRYIKEHRVGSVSRVVSRGWAWFYSKSKIRQILAKHSKTKFNPWIRPNFKHRFPDLPPNQKKKYLKMKAQIMERYTETTEKKTIASKARELYAKGDLSMKEIAKKLNTDIRYIKRLVG